MAPGTVHEFAMPDRLILDLETTTHTVAVRDALCWRINLSVEKYAVVLEGLVDTEANGSYAPDIVDRVRRLRAERFAFSSGGKVAGSRSCS